MRLVIKQSRADNGEFFVNLEGSNGEIMMTSEMYHSKWNAERAAVRLRNAFLEETEVTLLEEIDTSTRERLPIDK